MLKNNFGLKKLGFGGARPSTATRLASAIQDPSATNGLVSGGNWATGITSGVKGFLTGLGAMKDLQNERAYEQDMEKKYQDQLAIEAADKAQAQANWQATFDQNKANADRNYNLSLLTAGFDPSRMDGPTYVQEVLDKKRTQAKGEFAHAMSVIDSPEFKNMPKEQQQRWIDFANTRAKGLETVYNQSKAGEMGKQFLVQDPTTGELTPVKGSPEEIKRTEKKTEAEKKVASQEKDLKVATDAIDVLEKVANQGALTKFGYAFDKFSPWGGKLHQIAQGQTTSAIAALGPVLLKKVKESGASGINTVGEAYLYIGLPENPTSAEIVGALPIIKKIIGIETAQANAEQVPQGNVAKKPQIPDYNNTNDIDLLGDLVNAKSR